MYLFKTLKSLSKYSKQLTRSSQQLNAVPHQTISENMSKMKRIELLMNILYYCNYMIFYKVQKGMDWLIFSILDNTCTRAFCKSNGYWKYVNSVKQMYNKSMWYSENK